VQWQFAFYSFVLIGYNHDNCHASYGIESIVKTETVFPSVLSGDPQKGIG
jgi:hypothetical protein